MMALKSAMPNITDVELTRENCPHIHTMRFPNLLGASSDSQAKLRWIPGGDDVNKVYKK